jgi:hypothetical protein
MRRALLLIPLLLLLLAPAQARAGELIDRAIAGLESDNVYVDPDADPSLTDAQAEELRDRIVSERAGPMYVVIASPDIAAEAGGDPGQALREIYIGLRRAGTYVIVSGRTIRALSNVLDAGEAGELATEAIEAGGGDLNTILLDLTERVGDARTGEGTGGRFGHDARRSLINREGNSRASPRGSGGSSAKRIEVGSHIPGNGRLHPRFGMAVPGSTACGSRIHRIRLLGSFGSWPAI